MYRQFPGGRREDELPVAVDSTQLRDQLCNTPGNRKQVRDRAAASALRIGQLKRLSFDVIVCPRRSQQLEKSLTSKEDLASDGVCDLELLGFEALPQVPELVIAQHSLARLLELADAGQ
jgi:hypothetical protein